MGFFSRFAKKKKTSTASAGRSRAPETENTFRPVSEDRDDDWNDEQSHQPHHDEPEPVYREPTPPPREPTPPPPDPLQGGGYLQLNLNVGDGAMFCHLTAEDKVEDSLAYFRNGKPFPAFKLKQNAGRVEIIRKLQHDKQRYYEGFAQFIKMARESEGEIYLLRGDKVRVYYVEDRNVIKRLEPEVFLDLERVEAIACVGPSNTDLEGVSSMIMDQFLSAANRTGKAIRF